MSLVKGQRVVIRIDESRDTVSDWDGEGNTRSEALKDWDGVEFIYEGTWGSNGWVDAELRPIDGYRPDDFNGDSYTFFWDISEVHPA